RLFTDFRYAEAARAVPGAELVETPRQLYGHLGALLPSPVGFEAAHVSYERHRQLAAGGVELVPRQGLVEGLRETKDERELEVVARAAAITDEAYARLAEVPFVGRSEQELAWQMECFLHDLGARGPAFEIVVASGPNAALPHARPTERVVGGGETVVVDVGST